MISADDALEFRTKLLNLFVQNTAKIWLSASDIEALTKDINIDKLANRPPCMVAVDLSVCDDFSAVTYMLYSAASRSFHSHTDYYSLLMHCLIIRTVSFMRNGLKMGI